MEEKKIPLRRAALYLKIFNVEIDFRQYGEIKEKK